MGKRSREKQERRLENQYQEKKSYGNRSTLEKVYLAIIEWGTYLILFTPLIFVRSYFFPFVSPKTIFFRIIVDIIFIAYILLVISNRRYLPKINALTISLIVFLAVVILTSFTGINFEKSFWSTFERMTGILTFFHLFAFFIVLTSVFKEKKYWERILTVSMMVGILLVLYTLTSQEPATRGGGTVGNTSFMAGYLLFDIFFAMILFLAKTGYWRIFYGLSLAILLSGLFVSREPCRGAIGAFLGGIFLLALGYMVFSRKKLLKRLAPIILILVVLGGLGLSQTSFFKDRIIDIKDVPGESRAIVWKIGFDGWQEKPWLGWGQENFNVPFSKYFNPSLPLTFDVWYDRVHNIVLDTAVTSGILGLLSYLAIFGVAIFGLLRICPKVVEIRNLFFPLGMAVLIIVYFLQNIWVFDMISSYMIFFLSLSFIYFLIEGQNQKPLQEEPARDLKGFYSFFGGLLIVVAIVALYFGNIQPARASRYIVQTISSPLEKAMVSFQKVLAVSPMSIIEGPEQFFKVVVANAFDTKQNRETVNQAFKLGEEEMKKSIAENPLDFRLYLILGKYYNDFYQFSSDAEKLNLAQDTLQKAISLSPKNQQGYWSLAQTKLFQGKSEEAVELLQKAVDLEPRYPQSHWYLFLTYKIMGKSELALEKLKDAEKAGYNWKNNLGDLKKVIELYQDLQDNANLVLLYSIAIEMDPQNAQLKAGLAVTYANLGQFEKARQLANEALELKPDFASQLEEFLKGLPQ